MRFLKNNPCFILSSKEREKNVTKDIY